MAFDRPEWMAILARAPLDVMVEAFDAWTQRLTYAVLTSPETGTIRLKSNSPADNTPFFAGDATVTKCVVGVGAMKGYALVLGSDAARARMAAYFDALLQMPEHHEQVSASFLGPAKAAIEEGIRQRRRMAEATSVKFHVSART